MSQGNEISRSHEKVETTTYGLLGTFLSGLLSSGCLISGRGLGRSLTIGFRLGHLALWSLIAASATIVSLLATLGLLLLFVFGRSGGLDNESAAVEFLSVKLGDSFLNDTARIATASYDPTDGKLLSLNKPLLTVLTRVTPDDIVRARLRTLGVEEHRFTMESGMVVF